MRFLDYTFYRVCNFYKKKKDSEAEITSILILSILQFFTIFNIFIFVRIFWEYSIPTNFSIYWFLPLIILFPIINWNKYVKPKKYVEYRRLWKDEDFKHKKRRGVLIVIYLAISLLIPIIYGFIRHNIMEGKSFLG